MNPLIFVAAAALLGAAGRRKRAKTEGVGKPTGQPKAKKTSAAAKTRRRESMRRRMSMPRPQRGGNNRVRAPWTSFPWQPDRVTEVGAELLDKGEVDPERLTLAVAKTVYPVHPITGDPFEWPPSQGEKVDLGAQMIWDRIRLRVNTLVAADEERQADEATVHATEATAAGTSEESEEAETAEEPEAEAEKTEAEEEPEAEAEKTEEKPNEAPSPRVGRMTASPEQIPVQIPMRRPLTLKGQMRRRRSPAFDPRPFLPANNAVGHGVMHRAEAGETVHGIARAALQAAGVDEPSKEQVAQYVSLIVCSPANRLPSQWDYEFDLPGSGPYPWGSERPDLWLPKLNEQKLAEKGLVTTHGVSWSDGSNGITPPPELLAWRGDA